MRALIVGVVCALVASALTAPAWDGDDNPAVFWARDRGQAVGGPTMPVQRPGSQRQQYAALLVADAVAARVGPEWVADGLRIAKVESGYRCDARNASSGATGLGQLMARSAELLEPGSSAHRADCVVGARLMALHMSRCLSAGATTSALMSRCHLAGWGSLNRRLRRGAEKYVASYTRMVRGAKPIQLADSGWLSRGSVALYN